MLGKRISQHHRGLELQVLLAASTMQAVHYLIKLNDPERLRAFLAKHTRAERLAIRRRLQGSNK
jgi:hypothetical protein